MTEGLKESCTTSACPVSPLQTCSYVGFSTCPPEKPDSTLSTPLSCVKTASVHQKHPPPRVATSCSTMSFFARSSTDLSLLLPFWLLDRVAPLRKEKRGLTVRR